MTIPKAQRLHTWKDHNREVSLWVTKSTTTLQNSVLSYYLHFPEGHRRTIDPVAARRILDLEQALQIQKTR